LKISCSSDELAVVVARAARGASKRSHVQVLTGVRMEADGDRVALAATDLEVSIAAHAPASVAEPGMLVLPGRALDAIARLLPAPRVDIETVDEGARVRFSSGPSTYLLDTYAATDFPRLPELTGPSSSIAAQPFLDSVSRVAFAASRDESRPVYTGILVQLAPPGIMTMTATDGYRLAVKTTRLAVTGAQVEALIPARALQEVARAATGVETIELYIDERHVVFEIGESRLSSRRLDGRFQDYESILAAPFAHEISVPRDELLQAITRTAVLVERRSPIQLSFSDGELAIRVRTPELGEAHETLPVDYRGEALHFAFNAAFLRDGVAAVSGDTVRFNLADPLRPVVLRGDAGDFSYLVAPIRRPAA
jgi:DNA polymerase III subunit beta